MDQNRADAHPVLSYKQEQYLAFIHAHTVVLGRLPAETDLQRHFQVTPPSVHQMVLALEKAGPIRRTPGDPDLSDASLIPTPHPPSKP